VTANRSTRGALVRWKPARVRPIIQAYQTRVEFPYLKTYGGSEPATPVLCCLSVSDVELLRLLLAYARRRINWSVGTPHAPNQYVGIDDSEWEHVTDNLDDLEGRLMGVICVSDLIDAVAGLGTALGNIEGQLAAIATCTCDNASALESLTTRLPDLGGYADEDLVTYTQPHESEATFSAPGTDEAKCELAQAIYAWIWDAYTEKILPAAANGADALTAAIVATSTFAGVASFVGLPVAILADVLAIAVNWAIDGSIANFENWLYTNKDELVCILYTTLPDLDAASAAMTEYIDSVTEISYLDRLILKSMATSTWHYSYIIADQQTNGTFDDDIVTGYCSACEEVDPECTVIDGCDASDWDVQYPENFACAGGFPYVSGGYMTHNAPQVEQPGADFVLEVEWDAIGTSGDAYITCNLISDDTETQINGSSKGPYPVGSTYTTTWTLNSPGTIGELLKLQSVQDSWYAAIRRYCIREPT